MNRFSLFFALFFFIPFIVVAQWTPSTTSIDGTIHRNGSVGIGEAPIGRLQIAKSRSGLIEIKDPSSPPSIETNAAHIRLTTNFLPSYGVKIWEIDGNNELQFRTDITADNQLSTVMYLNASGLRIKGSRVAVGEGSEQVNLGYSGGHYLAFGYQPYGGGGVFKAVGPAGGGFIHADASGNFKISTAAPGGNFMNLGDNTRLTVTQAGDVGIGTTLPGLQLHVDGTKSGLRMSGGDGGAWDVLPVVSNGENALAFREAGASTPFMVVRKDGKVGIGTEYLPSTLGGDDISLYHLYVDGGILSQEVRVRTSWSDYVFAPDYHLRSLPKVAEHIAQHGHLHDTPSGEQIESSGLELGSMMANQQAKIEEIFLHLIEMDKRVKALEAENAQLKAALERR